MTTHELGGAERLTRSRSAAEGLRCHRNHDENSDRARFFVQNILYRCISYDNVMSSLDKFVTCIVHNIIMDHNNILILQQTINRFLFVLAYIEHTRLSVTVSE